MKPSLITPLDARQIRGLRVPHELYWVLDLPAPLAGMSLPSPAMTSWSDLQATGFMWVVCLCSEIPRYDPSPLKRLVTVELCDLVETELPDDPETEEEAIRLIADKVVEKLRKGEGVIVHCAGGRGRTGTVLGVALRRLGYPTESDKLRDPLGYDLPANARGRDQARPTRRPDLVPSELPDPPESGPPRGRPLA